MIHILDENFTTKSEKQIWFLNFILLMEIYIEVSKLNFCFSTTNYKHFIINNNYLKIKLL